MFLTEEDGAKKTSFKEALMALKTEENESHPSHTPVITITKYEEIKPENETVKSLSEIFSKFMTSDAKFKNQVKKVNTVNSIRISITKSAMLWKYLEDKSYKLYVTKINMEGVSAINGWELAQAAKKAIIKKITDTNRTEADNQTFECKLENLATSGLQQGRRHGQAGC